MIFDWYNGGDWGGLPVRRLGHIQADMINAFSALYRVVGVTAADPSNPLGSRVMKKNQTDTVSLSTDPAALASWFDGIPVGGQVNTGDPMRYNLRVALSILNALCEEAESYEPQFLQEDLETPVTAEYLGIDGLDADDPIRPQEVTPWAKVRDAYKALRYLRGPLTTVRESSATLIEKIGVSPYTLADVNSAIATLYGEIASYSESDTISPSTAALSAGFTGSTWAPNPSIKSTRWLRFIVKGDNGLDSTPLERTALQARLRIRYIDVSGDPMLQNTKQQDWPTSRGDLVIGETYDETVDDPGDYVQFDSEMTEPIQFLSGDGVADGVVITRGATFLRTFDADGNYLSHAIWDMHDSGAS